MKNPRKNGPNQISRLTRGASRLPSISLVGGQLLGQKAVMMRRLSCLLIALLAAGCAAQAPKTAPVPRTAIPAPPSRGEPAQYLNMASANLQASFGKPAFVRKDGATEMWRYDGTACRAFFFLYGAPAVVRHVETLPHGHDSAADMGCLTALKSSPAKTS
jgi:hypothetical protein